MVSLGVGTLVDGGKLADMFGALPPPKAPIRSVPEAEEVEAEGFWRRDTAIDPAMEWLEVSVPELINDVKGA